MVKGVATHSQVLAKWEIDAAERDDESESIYAYSHNRHYLIGDDCIKLRFLFLQEPNAEIKESRCNRSRNESQQQSAFEKWLSDKPPTGPYQFHGVDYKTLGEYRQSHGVVNQRKGYISKQCGDNQHDDADFSDVVVHRIDEDTSGVLIFAKNFETREALQNHWQEIVTKRGYYAIVEGEDIPEEQTLKNYLWLDETTFQVRVTKSKKNSKLAITHYKKMAAKNGYALLDVNIDTGRKNQIRVMLGNIGHYIIGDDRYGEPSNPLKRLGLHAYELDFTNPLTGKEYKIKAEMPACFKKLFWVSHAEKRAIAEAKAKGVKVKNGSKRRK